MASNAAVAEALPDPDRELLVKLIEERIKSEWMGRGVAEMRPDVKAIEAQVSKMSDLVVSEQILRLDGRFGRVW